MGSKIIGFFNIYLKIGLRLGLVRLIEVRKAKIQS
jgi:hypothetical protein